MVVCLLVIAMVAVWFLPRASSAKCGPREDTNPRFFLDATKTCSSKRGPRGDTKSRFFLDAIKIAVDTMMSAVPPAFFESIFREG